MSDWFVFGLAGSCAAAVAVDARRRSKNPWWWGTLGAMGHIVTVVAWFGYHWNKPVSRTTGNVTAPANTQSDAAVEALTDDEVDAAIDLAAQAIVLARHNADEPDTIDFMDPEEPYLGSLEPEVVRDIAPSCLSCGNQATCYATEEALRRFGLGLCREYQFDDALLDAEDIGGWP